MKNKLQLQNIFNFGLIILMTCLPFFSIAQAPNPSLTGYFHNWNDASAPYIQLDQVDTRYNIINVAFALPQGGTDYNMGFTPALVSQATFISQIQTLHSQGRKVLISVGGSTTSVSLSNTTERDIFISSMNTIITTYGFDGIDIDLEGSSLSVSGGTIDAPIDQPIINLIYATKQIMANYYAQHNQRMILSMAPETAFVQGGQSAYSGIWGAYLAVIQALRDSIDILHVQLYNSGSMYGLDGIIYTQGTADFIVAMTEAIIHGFNSAGGMFLGLPANKVAVGLPACTNAAGGGYISPAIVKSAIDYLRGNGPKPGTYTLVQTGGYTTLRGMMTWSINWDAVATCGSVYEYAANYQTIFGAAASCAIPSSLTSTPSSTSATLSWSGTGAASYNLQYKQSSASIWTTVSATTNSYILSGLINCNGYQFQVQSVCSSSSSAYSIASSFTTTGCSVTYCTSSGTNTSREYINNITLGTINNTSGNNNGYGNFTSLSTNLAGGTSVSISLTPGYSIPSRKENWNVYIDYNHNGSFTDAGEKVTTASAIGAISKTFTVPVTALNGTTRMRVQMRYNHFASGSCAIYTYGEVEDYAVSINGNVTRLANENNSNLFPEKSSKEITDIKLYPNPNNGTFTIEINLPQTINIAQLEIYNEMQEKVFEETNFNSYSKKIQLENIASGIYLVKVFDGEKIYCKKIIVEYD